MPTDDLLVDDAPTTAELVPSVGPTWDAWWRLELHLRVEGYECLRATDWRIRADG